MKNNANNVNFEDINVKFKVNNFKFKLSWKRFQSWLVKDIDMMTMTETLKFEDERSLSILNLDDTICDRNGKRSTFTSRSTEKITLLHLLKNHLSMYWSLAFSSWQNHFFRQRYYSKYNWCIDLWNSLSPLAS